MTEDMDIPVLGLVKKNDLSYSKSFPLAIEKNEQLGCVLMLNDLLSQADLFDRDTLEPRCQPFEVVAFLNFKTVHIWFDGVPQDF